MQKIFAIILLIFSFTLEVQAADKYVVDPGHSNVGFTVQHLVINKVSGRFKDFTGVVYFDSNNPSQCSVSGTIKTDSIDTANPNRDNDLKSDNWFDPQKYPEIKFESKKVEKKGDGYLVTGDFTMHGVTKEVQIPVKVTGPIKMGAKMRIGIEGQITIDRRDYKLMWDHAVDGVGLIAGYEVQISINAEAVKTEPAPQSQP